MIRALAIALALTACGAKRDNQPKDPVTTPEARVRAKAALYLELAHQAADSYGFLYDKCDSLEFTAMAAVVGYPVDIMKAQGERGQWFRSGSHDCYELRGQPGGSDSDIAHNTLLGLAWYIWQTGNRQMAVDVIDYGKAHTWRMGRGDIFRTVMRPNLIMTYYAIAKKLGADPGPEPTTIETGTKQIVLPTPTGYEAELQVWHTLLDASVHCGATAGQVDVLRKQAERQPRNALFQAAFHLYTDGDQAVAYSLLDDSTTFPADRLPTRRDRCEGWLWHRDDGADWAPCPFDPLVDTPHAGMDLRWALATADNQLRKCR